jgi:predicted lipoprotein with Yx(FWY)xxD motif
MARAHAEPIHRSNTQTRENTHMKNSLSRLALASAALMLPIVAASPATSFATTASAQPAKVALSRSALGSILVDSQGRTLYLFEKDKRGRSACASTCATYWPPLLTHGKPAAGQGIKGSLLGITHRAGRVAQVTYAGHPLYRFVQDTRAGQTKGQDSHEFGASWYVLSATGKKIGH